VNELAIKLVHYDLLKKQEAIDKMQFDVVVLLVLSVEHLEDDKDGIPVRAAFSKL
jgi:hypothetical protein